MRRTIGMQQMLDDEKLQNSQLKKAMSTVVNYDDKNKCPDKQFGLCVAGIASIIGIFGFFVSIL